MAIEEQGQIGLDDVYAAVLTSGTDVIGGTASWDTPFKLARAVDASFDPVSSATPHFSDNALRTIGVTKGAQKITAKFLDVIPESLSILLGAAYALGQVAYGSNDVPPYVAIMFRVLQENGEYRYVVAYKCKFMAPKDDAKTKGATITFNEVNLEGMAADLISADISRLVQRSDDPDGDSDAIDAWFTTVQLPGADNAAVTVAATVSSGKVRLTFSKTGGGSISLNEATVTAVNIVILKAGVIQAGTFAISAQASAHPIVDFTPTVAFSGGDLVDEVVTAGVKDTNGIGTTLYAHQLTF